MVEFVVVVGKQVLVAVGTLVVEQCTVVVVVDVVEGTFVVVEDTVVEGTFVVVEERRVVDVVERSWDFDRFERSVDHGMLVVEHRPCLRSVCRIVCR